MGTKRIPEEKKILRVFFAQTRKPTKDEYNLLQRQTENYTST